MKAILVEPARPAVLTDITEQELRSVLGWFSFAHPFEDDVVFVHDDDGIANGRLPNRTVNGEIIPGPFFILSVMPSGELTDLAPACQTKYLELYKTPELFKPGRWKVSTSVRETGQTVIIYLKSEWIENE